MKKILFSALAIVLTVSALSAKPKAKTIVLDFTGECPLTTSAAAASQPEKPNFKNPRTGIALPNFRSKDLAKVEKAGYILCPNEEKGEEGYYFPHTLYNFTFEGKPCSIIFGSSKTPGRRNDVACYKNALFVNKFQFTSPVLDGYVLKSVKVSVKGSKYSNERFVFQYTKNGNYKEKLGNSTAPAKNEDSVLEASFEGLAAGDFVSAVTNAGFTITKMEFNYAPAAAAKGAKPARKTR